jgi:predicted nucleotidyltransferase
VDPKDQRPAVWPEEFDAGVLLRALSSGGVDFVVIGGIAMVIHGSARITRDLDIVFAPDAANLEALGEALVGLDAQLRGVDDDVPFVPDSRTLAGIEILTLDTSAGWLDVHRRPDGAPPYSSLKRDAERVDLGGFSVLVASPPDLLAMKRKAARPQDLMDVEYLEAIQRLRRQTGRS